jgi:hypothetical protein
VAAMDARTLCDFAVAWSALGWGSQALMEAVAARATELAALRGDHRLTAPMVCRLAHSFALRGRASLLRPLVEEPKVVRRLQRCVCGCVGAHGPRGSVCRCCLHAGACAADH